MIGCKPCEIRFHTGAKFTIYTDHWQMIHAAVENWSVRTDKHTVKSLCNYIRSKGGSAYTQSQYNKMKRNAIKKATRQSKKKQIPINHKRTMK